MTLLVEGGHYQVKIFQGNRRTRLARGSRKLFRWNTVRYGRRAVTVDSHGSTKPDHNRNSLDLLKF
jgi:hypothetical protein